MTLNPTALREIAARAERIYEEKYKKEFEKKFQGKFVAIDVKSERAFVGNFSEDALQQAIRECPDGVFHLIRVGSEGAFRVSYTNHASMDRFVRA